MFERICHRRTRRCLACQKTGQHSRVQSKQRQQYGWECEACGSVVMDQDGCFSEQGSLDKRG